MKRGFNFEFKSGGQFNLNHQGKACVKGVDISHKIEMPPKRYREIVSFESLRVESALFEASKQRFGLVEVHKKKLVAV